VAWAKARKPVAGSVFIAHGEPDAAQGLKRRLAEAGFAEDRLLVPALDETFLLGEGAATLTDQAPPRLPPRAAGSLDWHNQRAAFQLALGEALKSAPDDADRERLLHVLSAALDAYRG